MGKYFSIKWSEKIPRISGASNEGERVIKADSLEDAIKAFRKESPFKKTVISKAEIAGSK